MPIWPRSTTICLEAQLAAHGRGASRAPAAATSMRVARAVIAAAGHGDHFGHGLGHGVGLADP